jgi:hypothetical protein
MLVAVAPVYIDQSHRFVAAVGPKSLAKISKDSGISVADLEKFQEDKKALAPEKCVSLWAMLFPDMSFIQANVLMDELKL